MRYVNWSLNLRSIGEVWLPDGHHLRLLVKSGVVYLQFDHDHPVTWRGAVRDLDYRATGVAARLMVDEERFLSTNRWLAAIGRYGALIDDVTRGIHVLWGP